MELLQMHQIKQIPLVLQNKSKLQQFKLIPIGGQNKFRRLKSKCLQLQNKQTRLASKEEEERYQIKICRLQCEGEKASKTSRGYVE